VKTALSLALCFFLVPELTNGQQAAVPAPPDAVAPDQQTDYNKIVDHFFSQVKAEKYTDAAHTLVDTNPQDSYNVEKHELVARGLENIRQHCGAFNEFKPLVSKDLSDAIGYVYGVGLYERNPIRFEFIFFKSGADWRIWRYDINDNFADEIRDQVGIHIQSSPVQVTPPAQSPTPSTPAPDSLPLAPPQ
jgi:hypothetical protein